MSFALVSVLLAIISSKNKKGHTRQIPSHPPLMIIEIQNQSSGQMGSPIYPIDVVGSCASRGRQPLCAWSEFFKSRNSCR
jgi:hypothetical protein